MKPDPTGEHPGVDATSLDVPTPASAATTARPGDRSDQADRSGTAPLDTTRGKLDDLLRRIEEAIRESTAADGQHEGGRGATTARERIELLLDEGSFTELDDLTRHRATTDAPRRPYGDGVVTGFGTIDDRSVCVFAQDGSVHDGTLGQVHGQKIIKIMDVALRTGRPVIGLVDSDGARIEDGVTSLGLYGEIFRRSTEASGVVPQVSVIMGSATGEAAHAPALTDFVVMIDRTARLTLHDPEMIMAATGEQLTADDLGGGRTAITRSGNAHYLATDEEDAIGYLRALLSYLPQNNLDDPPVFDAADDLEITDRDRDLDRLIPDSPEQSYDMRDVIDQVLDDAEFLEVQELFAPNLMIGFGRIEGHSVGIVANQPLHLAGSLDIDACEKAARFIRTCDAFNLPVITVVDTPGFLPDADQAWDGIVRRSTKLIYAYAEATVPLLTVIIRNAYGSAYTAMGSKHLGADLNLAWPTARIAARGPQAAVGLLHHADLAAADDPEALRADLIAAYDREVATPYPAAELGAVDAVIAPHRTRTELARSLRLLRTKRAAALPRKHGNIPL